jgi:hypothetical protein
MASQSPNRARFHTQFLILVRLVPRQPRMGSLPEFIAPVAKGSECDSFGEIENPPCKSAGVDETLG